MKGITSVVVIVDASGTPSRCSPLIPDVYAPVGSSVTLADKRDLPYEGQRRLRKRKLKLSTPEAGLSVCVVDDGGEEEKAIANIVAGYAVSIELEWKHGDDGLLFLDARFTAGNAKAVNLVVIESDWLVASSCPDCCSRLFIEGEKHLDYVKYSECKLELTPSMKWITVDMGKPKRQATLYQNAAPFYTDPSEWGRGRVPMPNEHQIIKAWTSIMVANYMVRRSISPSDYSWGSRHVLGQVGREDMVQRAERLMRERGLDQRYGLDISGL